jgi:hypothetical protein
MQRNLHECLCCSFFKCIHISGREWCSGNESCISDESCSGGVTYCQWLANGLPMVCHWRQGSAKCEKYKVVFTTKKALLHIHITIWITERHFNLISKASFKLHQYITEHMGLPSNIVTWNTVKFDNRDFGHSSLSPTLPYKNPLNEGVSFWYNDGRHRISISFFSSRIL